VLPNALEERGDAFYLSSILRGKMHQQFAYSVGDRNHNALYQFVRKNANACVVWGRLRRVKSGRDVIEKYYFFKEDVMDVMI
jgi:hypothetical protein